MNPAYIFFAPGFEEIEGLTVVDLFRRADIPIQIISVTDQLEVTGAHNITIKADARLTETDFSDGDMLILPGGAPGTCNLEACEPLIHLLKDFYVRGKYIGAICAAPMILGHLGFLKGKRATCYPGFEQELEGAVFTEDPSAVDGNIITSRGLGTAIEFAGALITLLKGSETADHLKKEVMYTIIK